MGNKSLQIKDEDHHDHLMNEKKIDDEIKKNSFSNVEL